MKEQIWAFNERPSAQGLIVRPLASSKSRMTQFVRDASSDSEEVITPLMLDGTYVSRNFATLGPFLTLFTLFTGSFRS